MLHAKLRNDVVIFFAAFVNQELAKVVQFQMCAESLGSAGIPRNRREVTRQVFYT